MASKSLRSRHGWNLAFVLIFLALALMGCVKQTGSDAPSPSTTGETSTPSLSLAGDAQNNLMIMAIEENGYAHLFAFDPSKSKLTRLTSGEWNDITPALSPDGKFIAFASNRSGHWDIYEIILQTGEVKRLTDTPEYDSSPTWSPDMAWIAYETYQNGNLDIALLSLSDTSQKPILLTSGPSSNHSPVWSPNGR